VRAPFMGDDEIKAKAMEEIEALGWLVNKQNRYVLSKCFS
jgi:hypothetical protein